MTLNNNPSDYKKFDLDLVYGQKWEQFVDDIFSGITKVEIKTERDIWIKTGNMVIEFKSRDKKSGITTTESDLWIQNFVFNDELRFSLMIPIKVLKKYILINKPKVVSGGDNNTSRMFLINIIDLVNFMMVG